MSLCAIMRKCICGWNPGREAPGCILLRNAARMCWTGTGRDWGSPHLEEKEHAGVLTGSPVTDMKIVLTSGRAHQKHTEGGDFRQATYRAVRQGLKKAKSVLLEPYYEFRLEMPSENVGRAMTDIQRMYGRFDPPETDGTVFGTHGDSSGLHDAGISERVRGIHRRKREDDVQPERV